MVERWRKIPNFPDYEVSTLGNVRSWKWKVNVYISIRDGRRRVSICNSTERRRKLMSRLVLLTWRKQPEGKDVCRHLNGNRIDDRLSKSVWGTMKENAADAKRHGTWTHGTMIGKITPDDVRSIRKAFTEENISNRKLATRYGITHRVIKQIKKGRTWKHVK